MRISTQTIQIATSNADSHGVLISCDDILAAVASRLDDPVHGVLCGRWFLEAGFGPCAKVMEPFATLEEACAWVMQRIMAAEHDRSVAHRASVA